MDYLGWRKLKNPVKACLTEYTFDLSTGKASERILADDMIEFA